MKLLLDTHVLLWWSTADRRLGTATRDLIASADNDVAVSAATFWEIAIKSSLGRIAVDLHELQNAAKDDGFDELPVRAAHTLRLAGLPRLHSDPFDRILIAQSIDESMLLVTRDDSILKYRAVAGLELIEA